MAQLTLGLVALSKLVSCYAMGLVGGRVAKAHLSLVASGQSILIITIRHILSWNTVVVHFCLVWLFLSLIMNVYKVLTVVHLISCC